MGNTCLSNAKTDNSLDFHDYGENGAEFVLKQSTLAARKCLLCFLFLFTCIIGIFLQDKIKIPIWVLLVIVTFLILLLWKVTHTVTEESLLMLTSLGLQVKTTYLTGQSVTQFVDMSKVKDIVINEGIRMHQVVCYLSVLLAPGPGQNKNGLFPLFMNSMPKICVLEDIYSRVKCLLVKHDTQLTC